jgi:hypothetical protein
MRDYRDLKAADPDGPRKWREWHDEREARFAEERACEERRASGEIEVLRSELHAEIAAVRAEVGRRAEIHVEAVGQVLGEVREKIADHVDQAIRDVQNQLFVTIERRFGELMGRIDAIAPDVKSRTKGEFRFANERPERDDEPVELPNPLPPRRSIN